MTCKASFVGRQKEEDELRQLHKNPGAHVCVIYGRRRVGKTQLVLNAFANQSILTFEGVENQSKQKQIKNFLYQLDYQTKSKRSKKGIRSWSEAFGLLASLVTKEPLIIFLDELQWMANYRSDLVSELKMIWDQLLSRAGHVTLVLCGSIASFMEKKVLKSKALYGRTDLCIHLKPFQIHETAELLSNRSCEEQLLAHLLVGGIPKYLRLLAEEDSILLGINRLAFSEHGFLAHEFEKIFVSHFSTSEKYEHLMNLLAQYPYGLRRQDVLTKLNAALGGELSRVLYNLESAGFISQSTPFNKTKNSYGSRYLLSDPFLRFYYAFIRPYQLKTKPPENYFIHHIANSPAFASWLGRAFEMFCLDHCHLIAQMLMFSSVAYTAGPYFGVQKTKSAGVQIDLMFDRADKVITLCEVKYQSSPVGLEVIQEIKDKMNALDILQKRTVQKILITQSKPTDAVTKSGFFSRIILAEELITHSGKI